MKASRVNNSRFTHPTNSFFRFFLSLISVFLLLFVFSACRKEVSYSDYVSELRSNIFLAEADGFFLRIYAVEKENPYVTDGIPQETSARTEVYLTASEGLESCNVSFSVNGKEYGGEMSFDNVKTQYYYSCTLDVSELTELSCRIEYGKTQLEMNALSVRTEKTLSLEAVLKTLQTEETELFTSLTDKYGFAGEIYIRLIYEDSPYYYIGIIDREGNINAFLLNAETGKILARRQS